MARRKKKPVSLSKMIGDHGPKTQAQAAGSEIVLLTGDNPNKVGRKQRINIIERMHRAGTLSMRQYQAANEIQEAYCQCEALSSGGPISERVQSSPDPDRFVDRQVAAHSRLKRAMRGVPIYCRAVVEHVCWNNKPLSEISKGCVHGIYTSGLKYALDLVANKLNY